MLSLSVVLPPSNNGELQTLLRNLYDPSSPEYHQWLKPGQFDTEFGPSATDVTAVESWLHNRGFNSTSLSGSAISVSASASTVSSAFGTSFEKYRTSSGSEGYLASTAPLVPQALSTGQIQSIFGLDTVAKFEPELGTATSSILARAHSAVQPHDDGLTPCAGAVNESNAGGASFYTLDQLGAAYGVNDLLFAGQNGRGETIGLYELGSHSPSDINTYKSCFGLSNAVSTVQVDGGGGSETGSGTFEADLDIEQAATQSPDASIISYEGPDNTDQNAYDVWNKIVTSDVAQVVSTSWGECEPETASDPSLLTSFNAVFVRAATQGQSIFAATGDSGSEDCFSAAGTDTSLEVDYPSSDQDVTAVGGTSLFGPTDEEAWNYCQSDEGSTACAVQDGDFGAGGGGESDYATRPSYQPGTEPLKTSCNEECRETPDVSANAGVGMVVYDSGEWDLAVGTSFAAPFWAGLEADRSDGCTTRTGFFNPALYALYNEGTGSGADAYEGNAFTDITVGNNDLTGSHGGEYEALGGYDLATGIGSPIASGLSCPEVTGVNQDDFGGVTTLGGLGLKNASVTFGGKAATVLSTSPDSATVVVPTGSGTVTVQATGVLGTGVTTSTFSYPTIANTSLASGSVENAYSQTLSATGGKAPYTYSITGGVLPLGLQLADSTGVISGTPAVAGTQTVTFGVTDSNDGVGSTTTLPIEIYNFGSTTAPMVSPSSTVVGGPVSYSAVVSALSGEPTGTVAFSVGSTTLCTTPTLDVSGAGMCSATNAPVGADTVTATYSGDANYAPSVGTTPLTVSSGPYSPLAPVRICDTRAGNPSNLSGAATQCNSSRLAAGATKVINVANEATSFGVPSDATAVVLNVTAVNPAAEGHMVVFPTGAVQPLASNLNYAAGQNIPNLVQVGIGTGGDISILSLSATDVVVDVEGYMSATATGGTGAGLYNPLASPARICDTRAGNPSGLSAPNNQCNGVGNIGETLRAASSINVQVTGDNEIPVGATAAVFNVTAADPGAQGFLTVYPEGGTRPTASNVNYVAGRTSANRVIVPLSAGGAITVYSAQQSDVVIDVSGYYSDAGGTGAQFSAEAAPVRICDTRAASPSNQCTGHTIATQGTLMVQATGMAGVPDDATAVVVNLTGVDPSQQTFLAVYPAPPRPFASDLNPAPETVRANLVVATVSPTGTISIYNNSGSINIVVDVLGWYA
jgi:hypothetical protein